MTPDKFNDIVKKRAAQRIESKIEEFELDIQKACRKLSNKLDSTGRRWSANSDASKRMSKIFLHLLGYASTTEKPAGYPKFLWEEEEEQVKKELLSIMDEMQKALISEEVKEPSPVSPIL